MTPHIQGGSRVPAALPAVLRWVHCPVCGAGLDLDGRQARCPRRHSFDVARQGYLNLAGSGRRRITGDTAEMVGARERFLARGHYAPIATTVAAALRVLAAPGMVVDLAGGTGYYLGAALDVLPDRHGIAVDCSVPALRRAARAHPRGAALGADVGGPLPLATGSAAAVLSVFGPRNPAEMRRLLAPGGLVVAVTPTGAHLRELIGPLGLLTVGPAKTRRLATDLAGLIPLGTHPVSATLRLTPEEITDLVAMGPSARHVPAGLLAERVATLPAPVAVTCSVEVSTFRAPAAGPMPADPANFARGAVDPARRRSSRS